MQPAWLFQFLIKFHGRLRQLGARLPDDTSCGTRRDRSLNSPTGNADFSSSLRDRGILNHELAALSPILLMKQLIARPSAGGNRGRRRKEGREGLEFRLEASSTHTYPTALRHMCA